MIPHGRPVKEEPEKYFCSRRTYEATQNSAMISFKLKKGSSFKIELTTHSATDGKQIFFVACDFIHPIIVKIKCAMQLYRDLVVDIQSKVSLANVQCISFFRPISLSAQLVFNRLDG